MTKPIFLLLMLLMVISQSVTAQFSLGNYAEKMEEAREYILSEEYHEALIILKELRETGLENPYVAYCTGLCYLNSINEKSKAFSLLKIASLNVSKEHDYESVSGQNAPVETWLFLGDAYRLNNEFREAIRCYQRYASISEKPKAGETAMKRIRECNVARLLQSKPLNIKWELLDKSVNQGIANFNPVISSDGTILIFTRRMKFYDAILLSRYKDGKWQDPENITTQLGSDGEFYPTALSYDGRRLLLNSYNVLSGHDIYESIWNGSRWTRLKKLDEGVNSKFMEVNGSYSPEGKTIFFSSNRENGYGGFDIYRSELRADGSWSKAINLGPAVNTRTDEKSPYLLNNSKTLIFSSQGHLNMGGYDFFHIDYPVDSDSKARNLGYPFNTVSDELSFQPLNLNSGFTSRFEEKGNGLADILKADYSGIPDLFEVSVTARMKITGIPDSEAVNFYIIDPVIQDTVEHSRSTANINSLEYLLYPGSFQIFAKTASHVSEIESFEVPSTIKGNNYQVPISIIFKTQLTVEPELNQLTADTFKIQNIGFDFNSHDLNISEVPLLNSIVTFLETHPEATVSITGYTDVKGNNTYNKELSVKRAEEVRHYLQKKGIEHRRMKVSGAGSSDFIAINTNPDGSDNPEGRKYNRRVEFNFENLPSGIFVNKPLLVPQKLRVKK